MSWLSATASSSRGLAYAGVTPAAGRRRQSKPRGALTLSCFSVQAVSLLQREVAAMDEGECGDVIVLPLYASLPPDQQVREQLMTRATFQHADGKSNTICLML